MKRKASLPLRYTAACLLGGLATLATHPTEAARQGQTGLRDPQFYEGLEENFPSAAGERTFIDVSDPLGPVNRRMYVLNAYFDEYVFLPVVRVYRLVLPKPARTGVTNFFSNLGDITRTLNALLQFKGKKAATTAARFAMNTTFGLFGLIDVATDMGLQKQDEDLGQTLGFYGLGPGPYVVIPILGPSSLRDAVGLTGDFVAAREINAFGIRKKVYASIPLSVLDAVQTRDEIPFRYGDLNSPFEYELVRYLYIESREFKVRE
jgi:phospholipid-binding lipoprotein MlaA